jgi:hypothetical protein
MTELGRGEHPQSTKVATRQIFNDKTAKHKIDFFTASSPRFPEGGG